MIIKSSVFAPSILLPLTKSETNDEIICLHEQLKQKVGKNRSDNPSNEQLTSLSSWQYCFRATLMGFLPYFLKQQKPELLIYLLKIER